MSCGPERKPFSRGMKNVVLRQDGERESQRMWESKAFPALGPTEAFSWESGS